MTNAATTQPACTCPMGPPSAGDLDIHVDDCPRPSHWLRRGEVLAAEAGRPAEADWWPPLSS